MFTLNMIMRLNALSCIIFGLLFLILTEDVILFLSTDSQIPNFILELLGIVLIINGLHLIFEARASKPKKIWVLYFSIGDFIWVIASMVLVITQMWITTTNGIISTAVVSAMVGTFGILQIIKIRKSNG